MKIISRYPNNPIISPKNVKPSADGLKVLGAFNPGATMYKDEIILLLRVAETCNKKKNISYKKQLRACSKYKIIKSLE